MLFQIAQQIGVNLNMIIQSEPGKQNYYNVNDAVENGPTIHIVNTSGVHYDAAVVS